MKPLAVGADIGGTFTDIVCLRADGSLDVQKLASTSNDYSDAIGESLQEIIRQDVSPERIGLRHASTIATNTILEFKGAKSALITTRGFRDVLELGRLRSPKNYQLIAKKPKPLIERRFRYEVDERINSKGEVVKGVNVEEVEKIVEALRSEKIESVAICLINAYANEAHEQQIADVIQTKCPNIILTTSSRLLPILKEYERTSSTVVNAYIRPVVSGYLENLQARLKEMQINKGLMVMQSNGGLSDCQSVREKPITCVESGPAAGVVGAYAIAKKMGIDDVITFDMGGTTAKASIIEDGDFLIANEYEVGEGINVGSRLTKGSGYMLMVPSIDIAEVSAGGGSIARVRSGVTLQIGPDSAGATPGPVCYDRGGDEPTVTDANVFLGYINRESLLNGAFPINSEKSSGVIEAKIAAPLSLENQDAAYGIHTLSNSNMARALKAVSSERGRDPRKFCMMAFGGNGPVHAALLADMMGIKRILIPPHPGVFSALGLLLADAEQHFARSCYRSLNDCSSQFVNAIIQSMMRQVVGDQSGSEGNFTYQIQCDLRYRGQYSDMTIPLEGTRFSEESIPQLSRDFAEAHQRDFGYVTEDELQMVNVRLIAKQSQAKTEVPSRFKIESVATKKEKRGIFFGKDAGWVETEVIDRMEVQGKKTGPLIVEEYDSTTVVPPGWSIELDNMMSIVMTK